MSKRTQTQTRALRPQDDLFQYVNEEWLNENEIPDEYSVWNNFIILGERSLKQQLTILNELQKKDPEHLTHEEKLVRKFYNSAMNRAKREENKMEPLNKYFSIIFMYRLMPTSLSYALGNMHLIGVPVFFSLDAEPDEKNSDLIIPHLNQSGLVLDDRDYYLKDNHAELRKQYVEHIVNMGRIIGYNWSQMDAESILNFETRIAETHMASEDLRDPQKSYHRMSYEEIEQLMPNLSIYSYMNAYQNDTFEYWDPNDGDRSYFIVDNPEHLKKINQLVAETDTRTMSSYLAWHVLCSFAGCLTKELYDEHFAFFGEILQGKKEQKPEWKRSLIECNHYLGMALGKAYVMEYFPEKNKKMMLELVNNLIFSVRDRLAQLDWMSQTTKDRAYQKLMTMKVKVGYPDKWMDFSELEFDNSMDSSSYLDLIIQCEIFHNLRNMKKWYQLVDRREWIMTPQTVNAYYWSSMNEIVFPAAILQAPFFDPLQSIAENYGAIGAVIGHEITHGFDDSGRQYDELGNLNDWWTPEDLERFKEKSQNIIEQYNQLPVYDQHVNGKLTIGENIADIGGVKIAYYAMIQHICQKYGFKTEQEVPNSFKRDFFMSWSRAWRNKFRKKEALNRVITDCHSPPHYRVNVVVSNLLEFRNAFHVQTTDLLYNPNPVSLW